MQSLTSNVNNVMNYLNNIMHLELGCYEMQRYIGILQKDLRRANNPVYYELEDDELPVTWSSHVLSGLLWAIVVTVVAVVGTFVAALVLWFPLWILSLFHIPLYALLYKYNGVEFLMIVLGVIAFAGTFYMVTFEESHTAEENRRKNAIARRNNEEKKKKNKQIQTASQMKAALLSAELGKAQTLLGQTTQTLQSYYNQNVIYRKYWGLVPIAMFNEYFATGRARTLPDAYDRYEMEIRLNQISDKLDVIINRLDEISTTQYLLSQEIRNANHSVQNLNAAVDAQTGQLKQISENQEVSNYYNRITARNSEYITWLSILSS